MFYEKKSIDGYAPVVGEVKLNPKEHKESPNRDVA